MLSPGHRAEPKGSERSKVSKERALGLSSWLSVSVSSCEFLLREIQFRNIPRLQEVMEYCLCEKSIILVVGISLVI